MMTQPDSASAARGEAVLRTPGTVMRLARLGSSLTGWRDEDRVADFLLDHPQHRHILRRVQITGRYPYAEIRDNLIDQHVLPIDLLRCKLAFFGATRFDPRSDRWIRICMYQGAPFPHELQLLDEDDWSLPALEAGP